jgi:Protein of unknown function (DUF3237)
MAARFERRGLSPASTREKLMSSLIRMPEPKLEFIFQLRLFFTSRLRFKADRNGGEVGVVVIDRGEIEGPRLNGSIVPVSGGDWAHIRTDGVVVHTAHMVLQAEDGAHIYMRNTGYHVYPSQDMVGHLDKATPEQRAADYFRLTPMFETAAPQHEWLTRTIVVGRGERRYEPDHSVFDYYAVL